METFTAHLDWTGARTAALVERAHRGCCIGDPVLSAVEIDPVFLAACRAAA